MYVRTYIRTYVRTYVCISWKCVHLNEISHRIICYTRNHPNSSKYNQQKLHALATGRKRSLTSLGTQLGRIFTIVRTKRTHARFLRTYVHSFVRTSVQPPYMERPYIPPYIRPQKPSSVHTKTTIFSDFRFFFSRPKSLDAFFVRIWRRWPFLDVTSR